MRIRFLLGCSLLYVSLAQGQDAYDQFYRAIRTDDTKALQQLLEKGQSPNVTGSQKMTPLHDAALIGSPGALKLLLEHGAQVESTNSAGATAVMYAVSSPEKTRLLLDHGADAKVLAGSPPPFGGETSALMRAAVRPGNIATVRMLLDSGAAANLSDSQGTTALHRAAAVGDTEIMTLLISKGADVNAPAKANAAITPLMAAVMSRKPAAVRLLIAKGATVNTATPTDNPARVKNGPIDLGGQTALHFAAPYGPPEIIKLLLDAGANVNAKDIQGMTPLMWSIASDYQNPEITRMLLARGADSSIKSRDGQTALALARRLGAAPGIRILGGNPPVLGGTESKSKEQPDVKTALLRGLGILDLHASATFLQSGGCVACHAQMAAQSAASTSAKLARVSTDEAAKRIQILKSGLEGAALQGASGEGFLYGLEALDPLADTPERSMDYAVATLMAAQHDDGSWQGNAPRAPIQDGDYTQTALSVRAIARYAPPVLKAEATRALEKARKWLLNAKPVTTESSVMRMLGLAAVGAAQSDVVSAAKAVLELQHADGGWGQRPELASDAYATGMTLWALTEVRQLKATDHTFRQGISFLQRTQAADGSWFVASRAVIRFQPYFESGFPYEHDQWISSMGTAWATKALAIAAAAEPATKASR